MTEENNRKIEAKLQEIMEELQSHGKKMAKLRKELLQNAANFETYEEMYRYIRAHTPDFASFCNDMNDARPIFESSHNR